MKFFTNRLFKTRIVIFSAILFIGVLFIVRGIAMSRAASPLLVTEKVRNLSAQETDWQTATAVMPGDVLEYFALIQLPDNYGQTVSNLSLAAVLDGNFSYREQTLTSFALGIDKNSADSFSKKIFSSAGLNVKQLKSGEFIDLKWQARLADNIAFNGAALPLLGSRVTVHAKKLSSREAETIVSVYSTQERGLAEKKDASVFYVPSIAGMNPREAYDDLGTGVLIAGTDLKGIAAVRLAPDKKALAWRLVSNELIEAGIPAGLKSGVYEVEFLDAKNNLLAAKLAIKILPAQNRATVTKATPNIIKQGVRRTIVLQGIHLTDAKEILAKNGQTIRLENISQINDRVLSADIPATAKKGEYRLFVGEYDQDVKLTVN